MPISVVFDPPLPSDSPSTFNTKAFTLLGDLNDWSTQANALPGEVATNLTTLLAAPPAIGSTTPAAGNFTTLSASSTVTVNTPTANVINALVANNSSATGTYKTGTFAQAGPTADGVADWENALVVEGAANGGLALSAYAGDVVLQTNRTTRLRVAASTGAVTIPGSVTAGAVTVASTATGGFSVVDLTTNGNDWEIGAGGSSSSKANSFYIQDITNSAFRFVIDSAGAVTIPGSLSLTGGTFGYGTGAGGTVTQATSKSTAVTLNKPSGQITMNNAALAAGDVALFQVANSVAVAASIVLVSPNANPAGEFYSVWSSHTFAGGFFVCVKNITAGSRSEALVINFAVLSGATS